MGFALGWGVLPREILFLQNLHTRHIGWIGECKSLEIINLQGLAPGRYLMKVTLEDGKMYSYKVVKE